MKTVAASLRGVDEEFRPDAGAGLRDIGRLHADEAVARALALPRDVGGDGADDEVPTLVLLGTEGQELLLARKRPGERLWITATGGEQGVPLAEVESTYRIRAFIEHCGEETELTDEIRLPPELKAEIAGRERRIDREREERLKEAPPNQVWRKRPYTGPAVTVMLAGLFFAASAYATVGAGLPALVSAGGLALLGIGVGAWVLTKSYELVVDREAGAILERAAGSGREVCRLDSVRAADLVDRGRRTVVLLRTRDGDDLEVGRGGWTAEEALRIAEGINDAIGLPEGRRKLLGYRRRRREAEA